jgi:mono/diheme cytochrome c family protein
MRSLLLCAAVVGLTLGTGAAQPARVQQRAPSWEHTVRPLFVQVCAECHTRDGEAGIDLATPAAWKRRREDVRRSVVVDRTMPPAGRPFSDADREIIRSWIDAHP